MQEKSQCAGKGAAHEKLGTEQRDVELLGGDCLFWASDFPNEATRTNLQELEREFFGRKDLSAAAKHKIARANPMPFYALRKTFKLRNFGNPKGPFLAALILSPFDGEALKRGES